MPELYYLLWIMLLPFKLCRLVLSEIKAERRVKHKCSTRRTPSLIFDLRSQVARYWVVRMGPETQINKQTSFISLFEVKPLPTSSTAIYIDLNNFPRKFRFGREDRPKENLSINFIYFSHCGFFHYNLFFTGAMLSSEKHILLPAVQIIENHLKVTQWCLSGSIPPKFEYKLRRH